MAEPLADGREAHAVIDQLGSVAVAELMDCDLDAGVLAVAGPPFLDRLVAQRAAAAIL